MNRDTAFGIVGSVILIAAMIGVFMYERSQPIDAAAAEGGTPVGSQNETIEPLSGSVNVADSDSNTFHVASTNVAVVTFHLKWTATNGKDTLRLSVTPPAGANVTESSRPESDTGDITYSVTIPAGGAATGDWVVVVDFVKADPSPLPGDITPPVPPPNSTDARVSYTVSVSLT